MQEWLDSMVCLRVFDYNESTKTYFFPKNRHAMFIDRPTEETKSVAKLSEVLPILLGNFTELAHCFRMDGPRGKGAN